MSGHIFYCSDESHVGRGTGVIFSGGVILKNRGDGAVPTSSFHFDLKQTHS